MGVIGAGRRRGIRGEDVASVGGFCNCTPVAPIFAAMGRSAWMRRLMGTAGGRGEEEADGKTRRADRRRAFPMASAETGRLSGRYKN